MEITPRSGILLIKKHKYTKLSSDIVIDDYEDDKVLITGEVLAGNSSNYGVGTTVICGKYAIYELILQGEKYYFLDEEDVIARCDYKE